MRKAKKKFGSRIVELRGGSECWKKNRPMRRHAWWYGMFRMFRLVECFIPSMHATSNASPKDAVEMNYPLKWDRRQV